MSIVNQELSRISQRRGQYDLSSLVSKTALAQAEAALAGSTFFDIETGGLKPEHGVYEAAFLHTNPSGDSLTHSFFKPPQENMSKFSKDAIKARPGYDVGGKELGVADLIKQGGSQSDFKEMFKNQAGGRDLWIHNLPFESRFVDSLMGKGEFENWATANKLESFTKYSPRLFETPVAIKELTAAAEAQSNARIFSTDEFLGGWEKVFGGFRDEFLTPKPQGVTRAVDSMTLTKSIFAMAQLRGYMPKTGELFAGSSVDSLAKAAFGIGELHTAADDAFLQRDLTKFLFSTGLQMESGEELSDAQKAFFQKIGAEQQGVKQRAAVANTIKVYNAQMQFIAGGRKDRGLLSEARTDSGNVSRTLSLKTYDPKSGKYVQREIDAHFRQPFNPDNTTESIDEWVASRKKIEEGRHGISPDWDEALKTVKRDYIPRFHRKVKARTKLGISKPDAIKSVATSNYAERLGNQVVRGELPEPVTHGLTKTPNRIKGIIAKNWKVGVGAGALLALASQFSGKDDEYNYIEGLKHQGFAGATRKSNTDFGSGWRGIIGVFGEGGRELTRQTGLGGFLEGQVGAARPMLENIDQAFPGTKLLKEYGDAHSKGIDHPVFITSGSSKKERISMAQNRIDHFKKMGLPDWLDTAAELKAAQDMHYTTLRGSIKHERFHQKVRGSKALQDEVARTEVPDGFRKVFDETYGAQGIGAEQKNIMQEEFLAHKHQYAYYPKSIEDSPFKDFFQKYDAEGNMPDAPYKRRRPAKGGSSDNTRLDSNGALNPVEGFSEGGFAKFWRKLKSAFGSPWRGPGFDIENIANFMSKSSIQRDPNEGLSKREDDERPVAQVGIRSYRVEDADTVHLMLSGGNEMTLRLAGIDAPETMHEGFNPNPLQDQAYGSRATSKLEDLLDEQSNLKVLFSPTGSDTYGRTAGLLIGDGGANINLELVRQGAANALPYGPSSERLYSTSEFAKAEQEAQAQERGMWGYAEWQAAQRAQSNSRRMTNATLADPQDIYQNFRAASVLQRMRNPDADFSEMMASGGKDDHNIIEGLGHGWANARRKDDIADFGSGYVIDRATRIPARSVNTKIKLQRLHSNARTYVKQMFDRENYMGHHRG